MAKRKEIEKHVTMLEEQHDRLKALGKLQRRSMRNTVVTLVDDEIRRAGFTEDQIAEVIAEMKEK